MQLLFFNIPTSRMYRYACARLVSLSNARKSWSSEELSNVSLRIRRLFLADKAVEAPARRWISTASCRSLFHAGSDTRRVAIGRRDYSSTSCWAITLRRRLVAWTSRRIAGRLCLKKNFGFRGGGAQLQSKQFAGIFLRSQCTFKGPMIFEGPQVFLEAPS